MEFPFDINVILNQEITILNADYRILNHGQTARTLCVLSLLFSSIVSVFVFYRASEKLTSIIDSIGEASYKVN
jgi:hypothetical protein